jgi:hypothetical protein
LIWEKFREDLRKRRRRRRWREIEREGGEKSSRKPRERKSN